MEPSYTEYILQVKKNAVTLAEELIKRGYDIVTNGTENHIVLWDLRKNVSSIIIFIDQF